MIMTIIWSFLVFDFVYILTQGGPAFSSEVLSTLAYRSAFYDLAVGKAAAVAVVEVGEQQLHGGAAGQPLRAGFSA